ncbi:NAD(P)(+) transhydrogenase (Re/Si-specific) subunit beta [Synoicihabitans lomoniglobus]|uniref:NAD(P) transhydrogenase subunit beta n=1 Tax=Synoicihabitans lomoniglobus TaxID=2909285 RepID=A0AAE9ZX69_9BACT|nr:NAD(P)(+) transhydrogenase (Re/Si-specific) subunit beta [Opitutaceae bacterium LMO-M01]WED64178.1 NAD(P)(+) transhydrogenase (Re/Si-specific) subunit beta [Opitutaceae bacterium LMO-M01]
MNAAALINLAYIGASILFIIGLKMLGRQSSARRGNLLSSLGMLIAVVITLFDRQVVSFQWILVGLGIGTVIGFACAKLIKMTSMPEMVALLNGCGGLASLLVGWAEYGKIQAYGWEHYLASFAGNPLFTATVIFLAVIIGGITFTGSLYAFGKLSGRLSGKPVLFGGQQIVNGALVLALLGAGALFVATHGDGVNGAYAFYAFLAVALILGWTLVMPIGGGDMPVVISMLNSLSGLAACAAGFVITNNVLIVAGCLVGTSGVILTIIMCKAMNRSLANVLFSGFGADTSSASGGGEGTIEGELKPISAEDSYAVLEAARNVVIVPGYGMAVSQAQHAVRELADMLEENGAEVKFAIHPVAGRMPGHMNVLLAEASVPYEQLIEMDTINPQMPAMDVAIVIGANDVVNPAAARDKASPIYGMPIINAHEARTVICLKRGKGAGFSGIENQLFLLPNTRMLYGDAKGSLQAVASEFKAVAEA